MFLYVRILIAQLGPIIQSSKLTFILPLSSISFIFSLDNFDKISHTMTSYTN